MKAWKEELLGQWEAINRMARRRFPRAELAEEAALFVMERLAEDDFRRLKEFAGRSSLTTYIAALTLRGLEDFARARFGRIEPPLWVRRLGGIWMQLFRLLCLERYSPAEAVAILANSQSSAAGVVEANAYRLLGEIPSCGEQRGEQTPLDEETLAPAAAENGSEQEQRLVEDERQRLFTALGRIIFGETAEAVDPQLLARVSAAGLHLETRERLLLQLCYRDGVAVAEAGRMLGWNRFQTHGRLRRLLERLRQDLHRVGLDQELRLLL